MFSCSTDLRRIGLVGRKTSTSQTESKVPELRKEVGARRINEEERRGTRWGGALALLLLSAWCLLLSDLLLATFILPFSFLVSLLGYALVRLWAVQVKRKQSRFYDSSRQHRSLLHGVR